MKDRCGKCQRFPHDPLYGYPSVGEDDMCGEWENIQEPGPPVNNCTGCKYYLAD